MVKITGCKHFANIEHDPLKDLLLKEIYDTEF